MARLIYAVLALALASLVAGFVVRTTAVPLIASVALSAIVTVMILYGWSKRLRASGAFDEEVEVSPEMEELLVVEVDEAEITGEVPVRRRRRDKVKAAATMAIDRELSFEPARDEEDDLDVTTVERRVKPKGKTKPKSKAAARSKSAVSKPKAAGSRPKAEASKAKPKAKGKPASSAPRGPRVIVIPGAAKYHKKGCRFAKGDDIREVSTSVASKRGYEPCGACKP
ncbi:MAG: hypothetical protein WD826_10925 [Actinomycetota bacterium]